LIDPHRYNINNRLVKLAVDHFPRAALEGKRMPFVMSIERVGICKGLREGIEALLRIRLGADGLKLMPEIQTIYEEEKLREILKSLEAATSVDDVRRLWAAGSP
jgi:hypothetical protein